MTLLELFEQATGGGIAASLYVGGLSKKIRAQAESECSVLFGTFALAQEGLDIPRLDTLILASPASDITQAVGRILRPCEGKQTPLVVDLQDNACPQFTRQNQCRARFYSRYKMQVDVGTQASTVGPPPHWGSTEGTNAEPPAQKRARVDLLTDF